MRNLKTVKNALALLTGTFIILWISNAFFRDTHILSTHQFVTSSHGASNITIHSPDMDFTPYLQCRKLYSKPKLFRDYVTTKNTVAKLRGERVYKVTHSLIDKSILELYVVEYWRDKLTYGGSNFYIMQHYNSTDSNKHMKTLCAYTDHYNGSYTARCPMFSQCVTVNTEVHAQQFQGFTSGPTFLNRRVPLEKRHIHSFTICTEPFPNPIVPNYSCEVGKKNNADYCARLYHHAQPLKLYQSFDVCDCLRKYALLISVGSSHEVYFTNQVKAYAEGSWPLHGFVVPTKIDFKYARFANETQVRLEHSLSELNETCEHKKCMVWIQFGDWPLRYTVNDVVSRQIQPFIDQVKAFDKAIQHLNVELTVLGILSQPDSHGASNYLASTLNYILRTQLESAGIRYIDLHATVLMCYNEKTNYKPSHGWNRNHYLIYDKDLHQYVGIVGRNAFFGQVMGAVCD